jgi:hypothetical protein
LYAHMNNKKRKKKKKERHKDVRMELCKQHCPV